MTLREEIDTSQPFRMTVFGRACVFDKEWWRCQLPGARLDLTDEDTYYQLEFSINATLFPSRIVGRGDTPEQARDELESKLWPLKWLGGWLSSSPGIGEAPDPVAGQSKGEP